MEDTRLQLINLLSLADADAPGAGKFFTFIFRTGLKQSRRYPRHSVIHTVNIETKYSCMVYKVIALSIKLHALNILSILMGDEFESQI